MGRSLGQLKDAVEYKDFEQKEDIDNELTTWINDGYIEMSNYDLSCFEKSIPLSLLKDNYRVAVPSNYRGLISLINVTVDSEKEIDYVGSDSFFGEYVSRCLEDAGTPSKFTIFEGYVELDCYADKNYTLSLKYYHVPDRMSSDSGTGSTHVIPPYKETLLVDYANAQYIKREKDYVGYREAMKLWRDSMSEWVIIDRHKIKSKHDMYEEVRNYYKKRGGASW